MNLPADQRPAARIHRRSRAVTRVGQSTSNRLNKLVALLYRLNDWARKVSGGSLANHSLDPLLNELESTQRKLAAETALAHSLDTGACVGRIPPGPTSPLAVRSADRLATRIMAECRACGRSAFALLQRALATGDREFARLAYSLVRRLEKLFWVVRLDTPRTHFVGARPAAVDRPGASLPGLSLPFMSELKY